VVHVVMVMVMMMVVVMMVMVMHLMGQRGCRSGLLGDGIAREADRESGGGDKALDHRKSVLL
jgi:hypothetical protein